MLLLEQEFDMPAVPGHKNLISYLSDVVRGLLPSGLTPVRFVVTQSDAKHYHCEVGLLSQVGVVSSLPEQTGGRQEERRNHPIDSIFRFVPRRIENTKELNAVLLVPTGVGAEIGGHAGDATPVARLMASVCDNLITHPNVINASDINELPENGLYVEGSVICRLLMGTVGLQRVRANRVLVIIDAHKDKTFIHSAVNAVSGARSEVLIRAPLSKRRPARSPSQDESTLHHLRAGSRPR